MGIPQRCQKNSQGWEAANYAASHPWPEQSNDSHPAGMRAHFRDERATYSANSRANSTSVYTAAPVGPLGCQGLPSSDQAVPAMSR